MESKILTITLVFIFVLGLVLGSSSFGGFTGDVTKLPPRATRISVSPSSGLTAGDYVTFSVKPGSKGANYQIYLYTENTFGQRSREDVISYCRTGDTTGKTCFSPVEYRYQLQFNVESGKHIASVTDRLTGTAAETVLYIS